MAERHFLLHQFIKKGDAGGWSKMHIFDVTDGDQKVALCGARSRHAVHRQFCKPIDVVLRAADRRSKPYNNKQLCKRCERAAQRFRNLLDRLAEIEAPE